MDALLARAEDADVVERSPREEKSPAAPERSELSFASFGASEFLATAEQLQAGLALISLTF